MNSKIITEYYNPLLQKSSFLPAECGNRFCSAGRCWQLSPALGDGYYWIYAQKDLFGTAHMRLSPPILRYLLLSYGWMAGNRRARRRRKVRPQAVSPLGAKHTGKACGGGAERRRACGSIQ